MLVEFAGPGDPKSPRNWPASRKITTTILYGLLTMGSTWSSAIYSTAVNDISQEFSVSEDLSNLGTSLILIGFGTGPMLWSPLSEIYGRKVPVLVPYFVALCFTVGTGVAADFQTVLVMRFLAGFFGSAPLSITGGVLADMFEPSQRGLALVGYASAVVGGPVFAPVVGSAIVASGIGWRWTQYVTAIYMLIIVSLGALVLHESYAPVLLVSKARRLRLSTGEWAYHASHEEWDPSLREMTTKFLIRPLQLLGTPVCFLFALHASFVYSIVYLNLGAFPIIFGQMRGWTQVTASTPFLALIVGIIAGAVFNIQSQGFYLKKVASNHGKSCPEARLPPMMAGAAVLTCGLFVMANTADVRFPWIAPIIGAALMGFGFFTIFQAALNYLVDTFPAYAASAVAANTFMRSIMASIFPPITARMYNQLGVMWATNMLGFIALAMIPIPWLFYFYGERIRAKSKSSWGSQRS
ncbi:major facilitator superfamily domain-containing protein [Dactylonectria estremocensis]|uniref:Major facilitator superfamily domain-containing protein n=1 Tax=Dactylonectria estremocensis TaxID=1079267 RepID=A0A9P9EMG7_9HYPO|nr:major facilitator superfamily domain-containing protein [Dactylonectria estremocensis]